MIEIRFHGRGGQGAVTCVELLAKAAISEGKYAQGFPSFGPERRGAPVMAFLRVDDVPIRLRQKIYQPDVVVILDPRLLYTKEIISGLKENGLIIANSAESVEQLRERLPYKQRLAIVDATKIALEVLRVPITNTTMLGALIRATNIVSKEAMVEALKERFGYLAERNKMAMERAFLETVVSE